MKFIPTLICCLAISISSGQNSKIEKLKQKTLDIAYELYKSELASWTSTDILQENFYHKREKIGGYLSYTDANNTIAIYYDKTPQQNVVFSITFPDIEIFINRFEIDTVARVPNNKEIRLIKARNTANGIVHENKDGIFTFFDNTNYNLVPIFYENKILVYSLTGPTTSGHVLLGNDYLFEFDKKDNFNKVSKIHNSLLNFPYSAADGKASLEFITHNHVINDYPIITETDICTLLLYKNYVEWTQCTVISEKYFSFWDMKKEELIIITKKAWDRIQKAKN